MTVRDAYRWKTGKRGKNVESLFALVSFSVSWNSWKATGRYWQFQAGRGQHWFMLPRMFCNVSLNFNAWKLSLNVFLLRSKSCTFPLELLLQCLTYRIYIRYFSFKLTHISWILHVPLGIFENKPRKSSCASPRQHFLQCSRRSRSLRTTLLFLFAPLAG